MATDPRFTIEDGDKNQFLDFLCGGKVLIVSQSAIVRTAVGRVFVSLGARPVDLVFTAGNFGITEPKLQQISPKIVVCDYDLGGGNGVDLIRAVRRSLPDDDTRLCLLMTSDRSQLAIAKATQEDVDLYVLKPFVPNLLTQLILDAIKTKVTPTPYEVLVEDARSKLSKGDLQDAIEVFQEAKRMNPQAETERFMTATGLTYSKFQYQCLLSLLDVLKRQSRMQEAYKVIRRIIPKYSREPAHFIEAVRLAISTANYADAEELHEIYSKTEFRTDEMSKAICAALVVAGKQWIQKEEISRAIGLFIRATQSANQRQAKVLREVIQVLVETGLVIQAKDFLDEFPGDSRQGDDYIAMDYLILNRGSKAADMVNMGWKLLQRGYRDPVIQRILIQRLFEIGKSDPAENLVYDAVRRWPDQRDAFLRLI